MSDLFDFSNITGFQWDRGNKEKNWDKHAVSNSECEEAFFNSPFIVSSDDKHSSSENRFYALGQTNDQRLLFIVFTVRQYKIRIISARDMNRKERSVYENVKKSS